MYTLPHVFHAYNLDWHEPLDSSPGHATAALDVLNNVVAKLWNLKKQR